MSADEALSLAALSRAAAAVTKGAAKEVPVLVRAPRDGGRGPDVDAGGGEVDVLAAAGAAVGALGAVDRGDGDDVFIGGGVGGRGLRAAIAGGGDDDHAVGGKLADQPFEQDVGRAGEAHIGDPDVALGEQVERAQQFVDAGAVVAAAGL